MVSSEILRVKFEAGLEYEAYVASGKANEQENWRGAASRISLTAAQRTLLGGFVREMPVLCISGTWCGDCVHQCPMLAAISASSAGRVRLRFLDRDAHAAFADEFKICGGGRVPVIIFMNEEFEFCAFGGDRTLARYRAIASRQLGPSCPLPGAPVPADEIAATLQDFVNDFERVQLMLRISPKLRKRHGD